MDPQDEAISVDSEQARAHAREPRHLPPNLSGADRISLR